MQASEQNSESTEMGELVQLRRLDQEAAEERMKRANPVQEKTTAIDVFVRLASMVVILVCITAGVISGALFVAEIAGFSLAGYVIGGLMAAAVDVSLVVSYLRRSGGLSVFSLHLAATAFLVLGVPHVFTMSSDRVEKTNTLLRIAAADLAENRRLISEYQSAKSKYDRAKLAFESAKNKPYKGVAIWKVTNRCTATGKPSVSHPKDCQKILKAKRLYEYQRDNLPNTNVEHLLSENARIKNEYPTLKLNQGTVDDKSLDNGVISKIIKVTGYDINVSASYLIIGVLLAFIIQAMMRVCVTTFVPAKNGEKAGLSRIKNESRNGIKAESKKINPFSWFKNLAEESAREKARVLAQLEHESNQKKQNARAALDHATQDIGHYLSRIDMNAIGSILVSSGAVTGYKRDRAANLTKAVFWAVSSYDAGESVKIFDMCDSAKGRGLDDAGFVNYKYTQAHLAPALLKAGFLVNKGTPQRAIYQWASEEDVRGVLKKSIHHE